LKDRAELQKRVAAAALSSTINVLSSNPPPQTQIPLRVYLAPIMSLSNAELIGFHGTAAENHLLQRTASRFGTNWGSFFGAG